MKMAKDMHNFQDMINSGRTTAKDLGLTDDKMEVLKQKLKHLAFDQSVKATRGIKGLAAAGTQGAQSGWGAILNNLDPTEKKKK